MPFGYVITSDFHLFLNTTYFLMNVYTGYILTIKGPHAIFWEPTPSGIVWGPCGLHCSLVTLCLNLALHMEWPPSCIFLASSMGSYYRTIHLHCLDMYAFMYMLLCPYTIMYFNCIIYIHEYAYVKLSFRYILSIFMYI